jgi:hypothetical protein
MIGNVAQANATQTLANGVQLVGLGSAAKGIGSLIGAL